MYFLFVLFCISFISVRFVYVEYFVLDKKRKNPIMSMGLESHSCEYLRS